LQYQEEAESLEEDLLLGYFEICIAFLYENDPWLYSSPSAGEGGVGVIFIFRCALPGHGR